MHFVEYVKKNHKIYVFLIFHFYVFYYKFLYIFFQEYSPLYQHLQLCSKYHFFLCNNGLKYCIWISVLIIIENYETSPFIISKLYQQLYIYFLHIFFFSYGRKSSVKNHTKCTYTLFIINNCSKATNHSDNHVIHINIRHN